MDRLEATLSRGLTAWARGVHARAGRVLLGIGLVTVACLGYAAMNLGINSDNV